MALKAIVESLDSLPEGIREHYVEKDGKFVLGVEPVGGFALEDVTGLKTALGKERGSREALEKASAKWKDLDPDKARDALAKLEELADIDPKKEADKIAAAKVEAIRSQFVESHKKELKAREAVIANHRSQIERLLIDAEATSALAEAKGSVDLLLPHIRSAARVIEREDGSFGVEIASKEGGPRVNGSGQNMTIKELVQEMRQSEVFGRAFDASGQSGTGKVPGATGGTGALKRSQMTPDQKAEYLNKHGQEAFLNLPLK